MFFRYDTDPGGEQSALFTRFESMYVLIGKLMIHPFVVTAARARARFGTSSIHVRERATGRARYAVGMRHTDPVARVTYAEYVAREEASDVRHEFVNSEIYAMAGGTPEHGALVAAVVGELGNA